MSTQSAGSAKPAAPVRLPENPAHWGKDGAPQHAGAKPAGTPPAAPDGKPFGAVTIKVVGVGGGGVNTVNNMIDRGFEGAAPQIPATHRRFARAYLSCSAASLRLLSLLFLLPTRPSVRT